MDIDMVSFTPHQGQGFYCVSPMEKVFVLRTSADYSYTLFTLINRLYTHFGICVVWLNIWNSCRQFNYITFWGINNVRNNKNKEIIQLGKHEARSFKNLARCSRLSISHHSICFPTLSDAFLLYNSIYHRILVLS